MVFHPRERLPGNRTMSRREALRLMAGTAVAGGLLAGCGSGGGSSSGVSRLVIGTRDNPVEQPLLGASPIESGLEPESGPLRVYNWADYIAPSVLKDFEKEFGVEVELTTFYNFEEAIQKLRTGKVSFDVFFPTADTISKVVAGELLQPINHDYLPNRKNVWQELADPYYDRGARYTVPYAVYTTGIAWRTDMVSEDVAALDNPWDAFWNPDNKGIAGLYDDFRESLDVGLFKSGITSINEATAKDLATSRDNLLELTDLVDIRYTIDGAYSRLPEGIFGIHHSWSGDAVNAPAYMPSGGDPSVLRYVWPPKAQGGAGGVVSNDMLAVLKGAENPVLAHEFLNYMLDEKVATKNFGWTGYQPPLNSINPAGLVDVGRVPENLAAAVVERGDYDMGQMALQLEAKQEQRWLAAWSRVQQGG